RWFAARVGGRTGSCRARRDHRGRRAGGAGCGPATKNTWSPWSAAASISFRIVETAPLTQLQLQQFISGFLVKRDVAALEEDLQCFRTCLRVVLLVPRVQQSAHAEDRRESPSATRSGRDQDEQERTESRRDGEEQLQGDPSELALIGLSAKDEVGGQ